MIRIARIIASGLVMVSLGCHASNTYTPMTVAVRDRMTQAPIAAASVTAQTQHFFLPFYPFWILDPSPPDSVRGTTGPDGMVRLNHVIVNHPVKIIVLAVGYEPLMCDLAKHPAAAGASEWSTEEGEDHAGRDVASHEPQAAQVEVRFLP